MTDAATALSPNELDPRHLDTPPAAAAAASALLLSACGGGGGGGDSGSSESDDHGAGNDSIDSTAVTAPGVPRVTTTQAARFLSQASMGITRAHIARVQLLGYAGWLDEQFAMPQQGSRWDWLIAGGYGVEANKNSLKGFDPVMWRKLVTSPDTLRQRITLALSEMLVVSVEGLSGYWKAFAGAAYADLLETHAFGNFRNLIQQVSTHPAMGSYLTFRGNTKANPAKGSLPDENYARELMQLFTIGLLDLNPDGSLKLVNGKPRESYVQADVTGLAAVFTGWDIDKSNPDPASPQGYLRKPMAQIASRHESAAKTFLGTTIPAGTDGANSLRLALDAICGHANVAPFVCRQLIQRLVTSNPSAAYMDRVSAVFANNGNGVRGDLQAVIKAVLLDIEARSDMGLTNRAFGKLREPMLRFIAWARAFNLTSPGDAWAQPGNASDPGDELGQSPGRSPSVFNFFRPGYVPPNSRIADETLVAPEFQITNESSVVGYINYMQKVVNGNSSLTPDYGAVLPLATDSQALLNELNLLLAAGQIGSATLASLKTALDSIKVSTDTGRKNRLYAALTLVLAAPEFIVQK